jgi:hypothetical protein
VIGSPFGLEQTVTDGIVSAVRASSEFGGTVIQITAPISPGSSGSPVINMKGQVIGVATFQIVKGQNLNFAIPAEKQLSKLEKSKTLAEWGLETAAKKGIRPPQSIDAPIGDAAARFFRGRTIRILVGFSAGGDFDIYSRVIARHLGRYIPGNPNIVVENMPGAASLIAANYVYNVAKPDGLTIANFKGDLFLMQALGQPVSYSSFFFSSSSPIQWDARGFEYIGAPARDHIVCALSKKSGITSMEKWMASQTPVKLGGLAAGSVTDNTARILRAALGLPIELISGYRSTVAIGQAAENGELNGGCWDWNFLSLTWREALDSGEMVVVLQVARSSHRELPKVPLAVSFATTDEARQLIEVGIHGATDVERAYTLPRGAPKELLQVLRRAFEDTMKDPGFLQDTNRANLKVDHIPGQQIERIIGRLSSLDSKLRSRLSEILFK